MVTHQLQVELRTAKKRWLETDVLPLSHTDQQKSNEVSITDKNKVDTILLFYHYLHTAMRYLIV